MNVKMVGIIVAGMLFLALFNLPYGYYEILRYAVFAAAIYFSWTLHKTKHLGFTLVYLGIALVFNPLIPVYLTKASWAPIDLIAAILFLIPISKKGSRE